ncbi:Phosphoribosylanthranilate isomerase [hydrothermal vent metagenome]|uniref:phosphoribosylanthranilate isomerase n=1 Tax=hydrothermal vent metagenome TaxID=652676 RepID=A0A1W1BV31_9ZZZZ
MRVKICGITNLEDALYAISQKADALGFVFYPKSPRYISPENAKKIIQELPPFIDMVGLFVNETAENINKISQDTKITLAQIHFDMPSIELSKINTRTLKVIRANCKNDILKYKDEYRLVDAFCETYGGSGKRLNLEWFDDIDCSKIILAGGLTPENLLEIKDYNFYGVDVSSATEKIKGIKDPIKVKKFINNAKNL